MKQIYIGVDGGGTKTKVHIQNETGETIGTAIGGPSNIHLSVEKSWHNIHEAIEKSLSSSGLHLNSENYYFHIGLGLAGTEVNKDKEHFLSKLHEFKTLVLESDAYTACLGAHNNKDGGIIIIGTGVNGCQIEGDNQVRVSGWGFPHDDVGGGAWLGLKAVRLTLHWLDGRISQSPFLKAIYRYFHKDNSYLITWCNEADSTSFASLAPIVVDYANQQDPYALNLMQKAAKSIEEIILTMKKRSINQTLSLPLSLVGGLSTFIKPYLSFEIQNRLIEPQQEATIGAIMMVQNYLKARG